MFLGRDMRGTTVTKDVDRNFSGKALGAAGVGSSAIFQFPGERVGSTPIGRFNGQNERISRPGVGSCHPLPIPVYAYDCNRGRALLV